MIDAATELDAKPAGAHRRPPRADRDARLRRPAHRRGDGAALADVDLANGRISVGDAKTEAGIRLVDILPALRDELASHRHANAERGAGRRSSSRPRRGSRRDKDNARERVIRPVVAHADELLAAARPASRCPTGVTAHKLRHTFASILFVRGEDPPYVMAQLGHTDPAFTLRVYAHAMRRDEGDKERLKALVEGRDWAPLGTSGANDPQRADARGRPRERRKPRRCRASGRWARRVSNLRPLACEASALPLSYAPQGNEDCKGRGAAGGSRGVVGENAGGEGGVRRSAAPALERGRPEWTDRQPFNPRLLPLDVYIAPTNSGMDVPGGVKHSGGGDRGSICWG